MVFAGNLLKFTQNEDLRILLLMTGDKILVEASPVDLKWGIGLTENNPLSEHPNEWQGTNWLGHVLMEVREYIRSEPGHKPDMIEALRIAQEYPEWYYYDQGDYLEGIE
jgi:hypothetical protein